MILSPFLQLFVWVLLAQSSHATVGPNGECPIVALLPFTARSESSVPERPSHVPFSHMATALLALEHFNARDSSVVSELSNEEFADCNVHFPLPQMELENFQTNAPTNTSRLASIFADDGDNPDQATRSILDYLYYLRARGSEQNDGHDSNISGNASTPKLCAVVGSLTSQPAEAAAVVAAASDAPFVTHSAETARIGRFPIHPLSARTVVDEYARGTSVVKYLKEHRNRDYVYVIYNFVHQDVTKVLDKAAKEHGMAVRSIAIAPPWTEGNQGPNSVHDAIRRIKESGFRTIVVAVSRIFLWDEIAREAHKAGLTGANGYVWMTYDTTDMEGLVGLSAQPGSARDSVLHGAGGVRVLDGFHWNADDTFLASWKRQGADLVQRVNAMHPIKEANKTGFFFAEDNYFQSYQPSSLASFLYDSVIALGMGACRAQIMETASAKKEDDRELREDDSNHRHLQAPGNLLKPSKSNLFNELVQVEFAGASGQVKLNDGFSYTRDPSTVAFGAYNIRPSSTIDPSTGERSYDYVLTSVKLPGQEWTNVEGETFLFADGTTNEPMPLRYVFENNYLSDSIRIIGFVLFGSALAIGCFSLMWVFLKRESIVVKAAQPEFLGVICVGSITTSFAILTLSFDESRGWSDDQLSGACMATPWLFVLGYIIAYSALFSKLWRIEKVLQMRRQAVKPWQTAGPAIALLVTAIIVLTVWTAIDPLKWERETIDDFTGETFGVCSSNHVLAFVIPLVLIMMSATILAGWMAWKTKDVSDELSETTLIFYAIFAQLQVWVVSIPIVTLVKLEASTDAAYLGSVLIIWTFALSIVLLIVGPRMAQAGGAYKAGGITSHRSSVTPSSTCFISGVDRQ